MDGFLGGMIGEGELELEELDEGAGSGVLREGALAGRKAGGSSGIFARIVAGPAAGVGVRGVDGRGDCLVRRPRAGGDVGEGTTSGVWVERWRVGLLADMIAATGLSEGDGSGVLLDCRLPRSTG